MAGARSEILHGFVAIAVALASLGAGALAWRLLPGGFPPTHPRFWSNEVAPLASIALATLAVISVARGRAREVLGATALFLAAGAISFRLAFRVSAGSVALALSIAAVLAAAPLALRPRRRLSIALAPFALAGALLPWTQRAPEPGTKPSGEWLEPLPELGEKVPETMALISRDVAVDTAHGAIAARLGGLVVDVEPLLTFASRSPDRCWTLFAPLDAYGPRRRPLGATRDGRRVVASFRDDGASMLDARATARGFEAVARSRLEAPVFSHLNAFASLTIAGHRRLAVSFSPCPKPIDVLPSDYPEGRPERFASLFDDGAFRVLEATTGEKGPFATLAEGRLDRSEPLSIIVVDDGAPAVRIVLDDWARQASTQLSPTAGWGAPANAIELVRSADDPTSPVRIWVELAATSVGRGWDSIGHAAGVYRNRIVVEPLR